MECPHCRHQVSETATYCEACGARLRPDDSSWRARRLTRSTRDAKIGGVCAGLADYLRVDVTLVRAAWLAFSIVPGMVVGGILAYVLTWLFMPEGPATVEPPPARRLTLSATDRGIGGVCGGLAEYFGVDATPIRILWLVLSILPGAFLGGVLAYLAAWLVMPRRATSTLATTPAPVQS